MASWIDMDMLLKVAGVLGGGVSMVFGIGLWMARREWLTRSDFAKWAAEHAQAHSDLDQRLDNGELRFTRIEGKIDHLATREDLVSLSRSVSEVSASVAGLRGAVDGVAGTVAAVNRLTEMLIQNELKQEGR